MSNLAYYFWLIILIVYILIPWDIHPLFFDDLLASGVLFYLWYRHAKRKEKRRHPYYKSQSQANKKTGTYNRLGLEEAYRLLGTNPNSSWEEVKKAYKEKISKSHPDKVSHLSEELQEKAKEVTLKLNQAIDIIKRNKTS